MKLLDSRGFSLLEVIIAVSIMVVSFAAILTVQSNALTSVRRARAINVVSMLAKQKLVESELELEGKTFDEIKKEDSGEFKEPYQKYRWEREIKEVELPQLNPSTGEEGSTTDTATRISRILTKNLSESIREVKLTIFEQKGKGEKQYTISTYWVNLNHEFTLKE